MGVHFTGCPEEPLKLCWSNILTPGLLWKLILAFTGMVTREEAGVAWLWVELAEAEGAVRALGEGTGRVLIEQLRQTPPPPEIDPEVVEDVTVKEVMPVGD